MADELFGVKHSALVDFQIARRFSSVELQYYCHADVRRSFCHHAVIFLRNIVWSNLKLSRKLVDCFILMTLYQQSFCFAKCPLY